MRGRATCLFAVGAILASLYAGAAYAQMPASIKIAVINDQSGPFADFTGRGSVVAAQLATEDARAQFLKTPVEVLSADHQNKVDVASSLVREWYDKDGVSAVFDAQNSSVALALQVLTKEKKKLLFVSGSATSSFTNEYCSPYGFQWTVDTYAQTNGLGNALVKAGGETWFFITMDQAYGHALQQDATDAVSAQGGKVLGGVRHPLGLTDFSSLLMQAQSSKAKVIGLATGAGDLVTLLKQAHEFDFGSGGQSFAAFTIWESDVFAVGASLMKGLRFVAPSYYDMNDETRAFAKRFMERMKKPPTSAQTGVYSAVYHYLKAVHATGTLDSDTVAAHMRKTPISDFMTKNGRLREDGRVVREMHLFEIKDPAQASGPLDIYRYISTIPAEETVRPVKDSKCPLLRK